jgi:uncharacterized protein YxeA
MKKIATITIMLLVVVACQQSKNDQAGDNAIQYVREQLNYQKENIKSVEVTHEDSVLFDKMLTFVASDVKMQHVNYLGNDISLKDYWCYLDSIDKMMVDYTKSWIIDKEWSDSLKQLPKYKDMWHKAFIIEVTMKSNKTLVYRVCMEKDGITPLATSEEFMKQRDEIQEALSQRVDL